MVTVNDRVIVVCILANKFQEGQDSGKEGRMPNETLESQNNGNSMVWYKNYSRCIAEVLVSLTKLAQKWLVCVLLGIPINKELMLLVTI